MKRVMSAAAALAMVGTQVFGQDGAMTNQHIETAQNLASACTAYSTREGQQKCIEQIAIETHRSYLDYIKGLQGNISSFYQGVLEQQLANICNAPMNKESDRFIGPSIQSPDLKIAIETMVAYSGGCLNAQVDAQLGEFGSTLGDFKIDMTGVPFDGNRLELIDAFRIVAAGEAFSDHPLRIESEDLFQAYRSYVAPAFTR